MDRECSVRDFPFKTPDNCVGESIGNIVCGYDNSELLVKVPKSGKKENISLGRVRERLANYQEACNLVKNRVKTWGGRENMVVKQSLVAHNSDSGGVTYSRVQKRFREARSLVEVGVGVLSLKRQSLLDLKSIFKTNIQIYKERGAVLDLVGSSTLKRPKIEKVFRHLFPIFYSENILIDSEGNPKLVDMDGLISIKNAKLLTRLIYGMEMIGSYLSIGLLDLGMILAKEKERE